MSDEYTSIEHEDGWGYAAWFEGDQWIIEVTPPRGHSFEMPFTTKEGIDQALEEFTGFTYDEFVASCGTPGLLTP